MALQNHQINLLDDGSMHMDDPHKFIESFKEALHNEEKRVYFDLKYYIPQILEMIEKDLGVSVMQDLAHSSFHTSSSFQLLYQAILHLASCHECSEKIMPQFWEHLIRIVVSDPSVREEPALEESLGMVSFHIFLFLVFSLGTSVDMCLCFSVLTEYNLGLIQNLNR